MESFQLGITDYVVFIAVLGVSGLVYYRVSGGKQQTMQEYFMADKNMSVFPVTCSLVASTTSGVMLLGMPKETYLYGTQCVLYVFGALFAIFLTVYVYIPVFFKLQGTSCYEYLELRFGKLIRLIASGFFILERVLSTSIVLYAPSIALSAVTGISKWTSILSVGFVCTFYSTLGGMKAVLWTDVFQLMLMFVAVFSVVIKGLIDSSGPTKIWNTAAAGKRIEFLNFNIDLTVRYTFWTQVIGGMFLHIPSFGLNQTQIQRLLTLKTLRNTQWAMFFSWAIFSVFYLLLIVSGLVFYSKYHDCDPVLSKRISSSDQLVPIFVMDYLAHIPGLAGLIVSGIFSGSLSTVSSTVNSLTAVILEDFIRPVLRKEWQSNKVLSILTVTLTCLFGILPVTLTFIVDRFDGIVQAILSIYGIFTGPLLGLFTLGMLCPRSTQKSSIVAYLIGIAFTAWIGFGASVEKPYVAKLPISADGCQTLQNNSLVTSYLQNNFSTEHPVLQTTNLKRGTLSNFTFIFEEVVTPDPLQCNENIFYLYRISYVWLACLGCLTVVLFGSLACLFEKKKSVNPDLLSPVYLHWFSDFYNFGNKQDSSFSNSTPETLNKQMYTFVENVNHVLSNDNTDDTKL